MDHNARREAANRRAVDDGRDMWGLIDWKQECYAQEDRATALANTVRKNVESAVHYAAMEGALRAIAEHDYYTMAGMTPAESMQMIARNGLAKEG